MTSHRRIIWQGHKLTLYAVAEGKEDCSVYDWLDSLDDSAQTAFRGRMEHLCDIGHLRSPGSWRALSDGVFEVKVDKGPGYRLYILREGNDFIATHGGVKPKKNRVADEVERARGIFDKYRNDQKGLSS